MVLRVILRTHMVVEKVLAGPYSLGLNPPPQRKILVVGSGLAPSPSPEGGQ